MQKNAQSSLDIDVWYGPRQRFGHLGTPQRWINLLGTVSAPERLGALIYRLNGGEPQPLKVGPDGFRLRAPGDFNAEIAVNALHRRENKVAFAALDRDGQRVTRTVTVDCEENRRWPLPYAVDWKDVDSIQDAVQIVDGRWRLTPGVGGPTGIRPEHAAYDRLVTLGDVTWQDYRLRVTATIHGFAAPPAPREGLAGGFGLLYRWTGHLPDGNQPSREWRPNGAIGWYRARWEDRPARYRCLNISDAVVVDEALVETGPLELDLDRPYVYEFSVRSQPGATSRYTYRVWPENNPGQLLCDLAVSGREGEAPRGSTLIIALYCDVTIGNLRVDPLQESW
jgi:hypothetical protein